jgi:tetratricopeptide (TPR) repeat protein
LDKDRNLRYQSAAEMRTDLKRLKRDLASGSNPSGFTGAGTTSDDARSSGPSSVPVSSGSVASAASSGSVAAVSSATHRSAQDSTAASSLVPAPPPVAAAGSRKWLPLLAGVYVVAAVAAVAAAVFFFFPRHTHALTEKDTVVLSEFVNTTGDAVFDGTLKQALAVQLEQSPYLNLLPESKIQDALKFMGRKPDERITKDLAREISQRENAKAIISGSIASLGSNYVITTEATNAQTGDVLARQQVEAAGKEQVLKSLDKAATDLRQKLGESLASVEQFTTPLEQATTSSLEALKAFSLGQALHNHLDETAAVPELKHAIELDPNFAMAHAVLGVVNSNVGNAKASVQSLTKAYELRARASEPEKLYITGHYYDLVTGDLDKTVDLYQQWIRTYPRDSRPLDNLSLAYSRLGNHEKGLATAVEASRVDPQDFFGYQNQIENYMALNRIDEAKSVAQTAISQKHASFTSHLYLIYLAAMQHDDAAMKEQLVWVAGKPQEAFMVQRLAFYQNSLGKVKLADETYRQVLELGLKNGLTEMPANMASLKALHNAEYGFTQQVRQKAGEALKSADSRRVRGNVAVAYAFIGDSAESKKLTDQLNSEFPSDTLVQSFEIPSARALMLIHQNKSAEAITLLEPTHKYELGNTIGPCTYLTMYVRGLAYLQLRDGAKAAAEFQRVLDHPGLNSLSPLLPASQLDLARAYALQGDSPKAHTAYQDFFARWKDADPDIPVLIAAKSEYAKLQ